MVYSVEVAAKSGGRAGSGLVVPAAPGQNSWVIRSTSGSPTKSDMKSNFPSGLGNGESKDRLPKPNARMKPSGSGMEFTEEEVRGMIANPVYAGIGPFPQLVADEQWIRAAAKAIRVGGPEQFLVNMLHVLRQSLKEAKLAT